jgi:hypothetical protein
LTLLYGRADAPDWFVLLSGADYPIALPSRVLDDLRHGGCDAYIDLHQIGTEPPRAELIGDINPLLHHLDTEESQRTKWRFYLARQFWLPILRRRPRWRLGRHTIRLPLTDRRFFGKRMALWWGEHWFSGNRRVAGLLLHPTPNHLALRRELKWKTFPEEAYYHTVLSNTPGLVLNRDNKRYTEWNGGGAHPMTLTINEVPLLLASAAHFARKFDGASSALDEIDAALTGSETNTGGVR